MCTLATPNVLYKQSGLIGSQCWSNFFQSTSTVQEDQSSLGTDGAAYWWADDDQVGLITEARAGMNQAEVTEWKWAATRKQETGKQTEGGGTKSVRATGSVRCWRGSLSLAKWRLQGYKICLGVRRLPTRSHAATLLRQNTLQTNRRMHEWTKQTNNIYQYLSI